MDEKNKERSEALPEVKRDIIMVSRGWFQSILFWPIREVVQVIAKQTPVDEMYGPMVALARIEVRKDNVIIFSDDVPWIMPVGKSFLLLQIYIGS